MYQSYYNTLVSYYGVDPSSEEGAEILEEYKTAALELLITRQLLTEYAQREGYTNYTQEQRVEAKEYVEEYINSAYRAEEAGIKRKLYRRRGNGFY